MSISECSKSKFSLLNLKREKFNFYSHCLVKDEFFLKNINFLLPTRFYDCAELRLSFLTFLLEHTEYRKLALYNISLLEAQMTLTLEQKIQIFRLRILIDEKQTERIQGAKNQDQLNKTGGGAGSALQSEAKNFLSEITLLKLNSQMNSQMESACLIYKDFWKELRDDSPSITKIEAHLLKSFQAFESVEHAWKENGLLDCLNLTAKRNYGIFVTQILERGKSGLGLIRDYYQNFKQVRKLDQTLRDFEIKDGQIRSFVDPLILMKKDAVSNQNYDSWTGMKEILIPESERAFSYALSSIHPNKKIIFFSLIIFHFLGF